MSKWREFIVTRLLSILRLPVTVSKVPGTSLATWSCSEVITCTLPPPEWSPSQVEVRCMSSCSLQEVTDHLARSHMGPCLSVHSSFFIGMFIDLSSQLNTLKKKIRSNYTNEIVTYLSPRTQSMLAEVLIVRGSQDRTSSILLVVETWVTVSNLPVQVTSSPDRWEHRAWSAAWLVGPQAAL